MNVGEHEISASCGWRTGAHACKMLRSTAKHCLFHAHWIRLVDHGVFGRQQYDEFCEWWEQYQPYGPYGDQPGQWWASIAALWPALTGVGDPPVLTRAIENELYVRRAEVRRHLSGLPWLGDPWPRVQGEPLPAWTPDDWQAKASKQRTYAATS